MALPPVFVGITSEEEKMFAFFARMLDTDTFEIGEGFGQSEPLTRRLHNLLKEYSDGFAVPKVSIFSGNRNRWGG